MADVADKPTEEVAKNEKDVVATDADAGAVAGKVEKPEKKIDEDAKEATEEKDDKEEKGNGEEKDEQEENEAAEENGDGDLGKLDRSIIRQVEYYFGDANLNRDKFLLEQISKDEEGWVPLSVLLTFKRLASLSSDPEVIIDALIKSDEGLLEISDDKQKLRRHPERPIPEHNEERRKEIMSRTAYAKGFPLDTDMSALIEFFAPYEKVVNISMRKYLDKPTKEYKFKGSVFVTFENKEQTLEFIEKDKVVFQDRELIRKWQDKYLEDKKEEMKAKSKKSKAKTVEEDTIELPKGTVLFFEGVTDATISREMVREVLEKIECDWEIAYIDFSKGDKDGHIRFHEADAAAKYLDKLEDKKLKLNDDIELTLRTLSVEEEAAYLQKAVDQMKQRRTQLKHRGHGHGHGHHGHGNRKRRGGNDNRREEKKQKASDD